MLYCYCYYFFNIHLRYWTATFLESVFVLKCGEQTCTHVYFTFLCVRCVWYYGCKWCCLSKRSSVAVYIRWSVFDLITVIQPLLIAAESTASPTPLCVIEQAHTVHKTHTDPLTPGYLSDVSHLLFLTIHSISLILPPQWGIYKWKVERQRLVFFGCLVLTTVCVCVPLYFCKGDNV